MIELMDFLELALLAVDTLDGPKSSKDVDDLAELEWVKDLSSP